MHLCPPGRHIGIDSWPLILSFELKFFVCPHVSVATMISIPCLSDCPYHKKRNHPGFVNISFKLVIDTSMERSSQVATAWKPKNLNFFQKSSKLNFDLCQDPRAKITLALLIININPTLVIFTSMERSSQVLQHGNLKIWIFFKFWWHATDSMSPKLIAALIFLDSNMLSWLFPQSYFVGNFKLL